MLLEVRIEGVLVVFAPIRLFTAIDNKILPSFITPLINSYSKNMQFTLRKKV